jgi:hypothetical protein
MRFKNFLNEEGEVSNPGAITTSDVAKYEPKLSFLVRRKKKKKKIEEALGLTEQDIVKEMEDAKNKIFSIIEKYFPNSFKNFMTSSLGGKNNQTLIIKFALGKKDEWPNKIIENDPSYTAFLVYGFGAESYKLDGSIFGYSDYKKGIKDKLGWRNIKSIDLNKIYSTIDRYFSRMKDLVNKL